MKILLLSDIPPCNNLTAGLVLSAMVRFLPRDSVCCFAVANPMLDIHMSPEFANIPMRFHAKPNENWSWLPQRRLVRRLSSAICFAGEMFTEKSTVRSLTRKAIAFGREQKVDRVWAVLQGQTTIRMARAVADGLGVPLHTQVWDPFSWWAKANCLDGLTTHRVQQLFDEAIRHSASVATASEPMAELYRERFHVSAEPVISSHSRSMAQKPEVQSGVGTPILIGMAGQFYAATEWLELVKALEKANWTIGSRPARVVVMGPQRPPGAQKSHVTFLGWKSQSDAAFILSLCDILYCPYPFDPSMKEVSQFSFPSKLVLYLAAGRPIVFHGPAYSSPARYIKAKGCGLIAERLVATAIFNEMERLTLDPVAYADLAANAQAAFRDDFTLEAMKRSFNAFIGGDVSPHNEDAVIHSHTKDEGTAVTPSWQHSSMQRNRSLAWAAWRCAHALRDRLIYTERQLKRIARDLALKIPRIRSLYHEIHSLYAERESATHSNHRLAEENLYLRAIVTDRTFMLDTVSTQSSVELATAGVPDTILNRFRHEKPLVLTSAEDGNLFTYGRSPALSHTQASTVGYVSVPSFFAQPIENSDSWQMVKHALSKEAVGQLLRIVLQNGYGRMVVSDDRDRLALATAVADLASVRTAYVASRIDCLDNVAWASDKKSVDVVVPPIAPDSMQLDSASSNT
ncbi:hypothetical protein [Hyphomicrobium sp. NDB2Meth4]|uniref:hypothetical protein n=1 Tax=Hyphomicrobium sp. NDB2Meth4 TaxID=1892846 RepID=UPI0009304721|nr:hypothetical protein [Hyphomicrobium sp. NDB2Meth4]